MSCHGMPRRTVGRGHSLFAEQSSAQDWGPCVSYGHRALTKVNMVGPRARNPLEVLQSKRGSFVKVYGLGR